MNMESRARFAQVSGGVSQVSSNNRLSRIPVWKACQFFGSMFFVCLFCFFIYAIDGTNFKEEERHIKTGLESVG